MFEQIISGIVQGLTEWLPLSSEGMVVLVKTRLFHSGHDLNQLVLEALFLHLGTLVAAAVYLRKEVAGVFRSLVNYPKATLQEQRLLIFLCVTTIISGGLGFGILKLAVNFTKDFESTGKMISVGIGLLLLITAMLQIRIKHGGARTAGDLTLVDAILLGIIQGLAVLPGLSRSGLTVSALLLRQFDKTQSLRISFLMSMPIIALGNVILNFHKMHLTLPSLAALFFAFLFGIITISGVFRLVAKINFGYFVLGFGLLVLLSTVI